jgi:lysophospholipase L1-like esterase
MEGVGGSSPLSPTIPCDPIAAVPKIFLIGDSISIGYTPEVTRLLAGRADVTHSPGNAQYTAWGLRYLREWLGPSKWDAIHFNWGIWDLHHLGPGADPLEPSVNALQRAGVRRTTPEQYAVNLEAIVRILEPTGATLIWATITPLKDRDDLCVVADDVPVYNAVARRIMSAHGIRINDLYSHVLPERDRLLDPDGCHFTEDGYRYLGRQVARAIMEVV